MSKKKKIICFLTGVAAIGLITITQKALIEWPPMIGSAIASLL